MKERPLLFSAPMVRAILAGTKTQTRRVVKPQPFKPDPSRPSYFPFQPDDWVWSANSWSSTISNSPEGPAGWSKHCPYGQPGDRLWVRETWQEVHPLLAEGRESKLGRAGIPGPPKVVYRTIYRADGECANLYHCAEPPFRTLSGETVADEVVWRPSIHMPRWASRITLEIVSVRVERLNAISEADAVAEGINRYQFYPDEGFPLCNGYTHKQDDGKCGLWPTAKQAYRDLWESINGPREPKHIRRRRAKGKPVDRDPPVNGSAWDANPWVWVVEFRRVKP